MDCSRSGAATVSFRHELLRRTIESSMGAAERALRCRIVLRGLPEETHPNLLIECAVVAGDIDRLLELAPRSARYAAMTGSHIQAVDDYRVLGPYIDRLDRDQARLVLDEWAVEEDVVDNVAEAIRLNGLARELHHEAGDLVAESRALAAGARYHEGAGQRGRAEALAREAVTVLGPEPDRQALARALETIGNLEWMAGNVRAVPLLVEQTLAAGGPDIEDITLIRSLNHRGAVANIADYPAGRASLDAARERAEATGYWFEECRALLNHAWGAVEAQDLPIASDYAQRAIASAVRHELPSLEANARAQLARVLELRGRWTEASDVAHDLLGAGAIPQMVALPILAVIEARRGRMAARDAVERGWRMALVADEVQRLAPAAAAAAEFAWIHGDAVVAIADIQRVMHAALDLGFVWSPGRLAYWLWQLGALVSPPSGIAEPYRLAIEGRVTEAAAMWSARRIPTSRPWSWHTAARRSGSRPSTCSRGWVRPPSRPRHARRCATVAWSCRAARAGRLARTRQA